MPIGYANFSTINAANNQTVNSLAGLGQQIAGAIENHAQTQAAQAMLPALQQSYQQGMQKIARGNPNGMADIYGAAATASQIPLLQPFANHAITTAQSANINAQHMLRTQAYLGGKMAGLYGQYGSGLMNAPAGMNPNWAGKQATAKATTVADLKNANSLDNDLATKAEQALRLGDQGEYDQLTQQRLSLRNQFPNITLPALSGAMSNFDTASQLSNAQKTLKNEMAKKANFLGLGGPDQTKIQEAKNTIQKLQGQGQLPSSTQGGTGPVIPQKAIDYLQKNPNTANDFDSLFGKGAAQQILKPQTSIDTTGGNEVSQNTPESADESEAVGGTEEETPSYTQGTMAS